MSDISHSAETKNTEQQNRQDILEKMEILLEDIRIITGLMYLGNVAKFDELDEEIYNHFLTGVARISHKAFVNGVEIQGLMCSHH